jgi:uncharacterized protein
MSRMGKSIRKVAKKIIDDTPPGQYFIEGKKIACSHCGGNEFGKGKALLNTTWMTFFSLDWANKSATTLACTRCGKIQLFLKEPQMQSS